MEIMRRINNFLTNIGYSIRKFHVFRFTNYNHFYVEVYKFFYLHGFHIAKTRSGNNKKQEEPMATINNEMKCYFEKLIKPLVTTYGTDKWGRKPKAEKNKYPQITH